MTRQKIRMAFIGHSGMRNARLSFNVDGGYMLGLSANEQAAKRFDWEAFEYGQYIQKGREILMSSDNGDQRIFKLKIDFWPLRKRLFFLSENIKTNEKYALRTFEFYSTRLFGTTSAFIRG